MRCLLIAVWAAALGECCMQMPSPTTTTTIAPTTTTSCPSCADTAQTSAPSSVQQAEYFSFGDCGTATNNCPANGVLRLETDQGAVTVEPTESAAVALTCSGSSYETTVEGKTYAVTGDICYVARCAECPDPTVSSGITFETTFDDSTFCKRVAFSGCPFGYQVAGPGSIQVKISESLPCVDYGETKGGRWFTSLLENTNLVSCR